MTRSCRNRTWALLWAKWLESSEVTTPVPQVLGKHASLVQDAHDSCAMQIWFKSSRQVHKGKNLVVMLMTGALLAHAGVWSGCESVVKAVEMVKSNDTKGRLLQLGLHYRSACSRPKGHTAGKTHLVTLCRWVVNQLHHAAKALSSHRTCLKLVVGCLFP